MANGYQTATQKKLQKKFTYNQKDGRLYYKHSHGNCAAGQLAGYSTGTCIYVGLEGVRYPLQTLIWAYHYGAYPAVTPYHLDGNRTNTKINNLTLESKYRCGAKISDHPGTLGGVYLDGFTGRWWVSMVYQKKTYYLGRFDTYPEAYTAREKAEERKIAGLPIKPGLKQKRGPNIVERPEQKPQATKKQYKNCMNILERLMKEAKND
jgi:hypothetical protein